MVVGLLTAVFLFISFKTLPVYLAKLNFEDGLARIASRAGVESATDAVIQTRVQALADGSNFEVTPEDVTIQRTSKFSSTPEITIRVVFRRKVEFPGYTHVFHFESKVSSFVGRL